MMESSTGHKDLSLEGVRGIAAMMVMMGHTVIAYRPSLYDAYWPRMTHQWEKVFVSSPLRLLFEANVAVCIFFILSGQVLTRGAFRASPADLSARFLRRPLRLGIPLLFSNLLILVLLEAGILDGFKHPTLGTLWWVAPGQLTFWSAIYAAFIGTPFHGDVRWQIVHWSLKFEFYGSFLAISLAAVLRNRDQLMLILAGSAIVVGWLWTPYYSAFVVGVMCTLWFDSPNRPRSAPSVRRTALRLGGVVISVFLMMRPLASFGPWLQTDRFLNWIGVGDLEAATHVAGASILYVLLQSSAGSRAFLSKGLFVKLGEASFGIYLLHMPFLYAVTWRFQEFFEKSLSSQSSAVLSAALTFILLPVIAYFGFGPVDRLAVSLSKRLVPGVGARKPSETKSTTEIADTKVDDSN